MPNILDGKIKTQREHEAVCFEHMALRQVSSFDIPWWCPYLRSQGTKSQAKLIHEKGKDQIILTLDTVQSTIFLCNQGTHKLSLSLQSKHQTRRWLSFEFNFRFPGHFLKLRKPCLTTKGNLVLASCICSFSTYLISMQFISKKTTSKFHNEHRPPGTEK